MAERVFVGLVLSTLVLAFAGRSAWAQPAMTPASEPVTETSEPSGDWCPAGATCEDAQPDPVLSSTTEESCGDGCTVVRTCTTYSDGSTHCDETTVIEETPRITCPDGTVVNEGETCPDGTVADCEAAGCQSGEPEVVDGPHTVSDGGETSKHAPDVTGDTTTSTTSTTVVEEGTDDGRSPAGVDDRGLGPRGGDDTASGSGGGSSSSAPVPVPVAAAGGAGVLALAAGILVMQRRR